jgi:dolichol-phosphate mannosyltransferase
LSEIAATPLTAAAAAGLPHLSVVIPFYNEEQCAGAVLAEVREALAHLNLPYEVLAVDDGSTDGTASVLAAAELADARFRLLRSQQNRGQAAALYWGLHNARAPIIATMDGDGQNDPSDIPALLAGLGDADMVVGIRATRHDSLLRRGMSRLANAVRGRLLRDHMRDSGCALKVLRREVVDSFIPIKTLYSFMPALAVAAGFRVEQQVVRHRARRGGRSSYGLRQFLWRPLVDLLGVWWFTRRRFGTIDPD